MCVCCRLTLLVAIGTAVYRFSESGVLGMRMLQTLLLGPLFVIAALFIYSSAQRV